MAIDKTLKLQIRAIYESNNLSVAKIMSDRFSDADVSVKTVESWVGKDDWKKNRFESFNRAMSELFDKSMDEQLAQKGRELLESEVVDDDPPNYGDEITKEAIRKAVTAHSLVDMMSENLLQAQKFAKVSRNIGTNATFQGMLIQTYQTIHGKEVRFTPKDYSSERLSDEDIENMSKEEQLALISELESELEDGQS